ncbi:pre-mRNA-splicing factor prp46 [Gryganskiella cystojenkinii]|nr:pre-mRNA-splicing factor prp46 [Gryganskiella cystojenkinii]
MSHDRSSQSPSSEHFHETLDLQSSPRNEQLAQPFQEQTPDVRLELEDASQRGLTEQSEGTPQPLDVDAREQSAKPSRKTKAVKRTLTPKPSVPAVPKKKELSVVCHKLLDSFIRKDSYLLFSQPVDPNLVPDYSTVIKNPMDFSTMRAKVERNFYPNIDEFLADFKLVCDNARLYNSKETLYWKQADKLWDWGSRAIERDRKSIMDKEDGMQKLIKDEENLDVVGMGDQGLTIHTVTAPSASRPSMLSIDGALDSPMSLAESGRPHTPQHYRKSKKIKHRRDGTIAFSYSTDGSIDPASHPDPWSLVPIGSSFGAKPSLSTPIEKSDPYYGLVLDDYPYWKSPCTTATQVATFLDYGAFSNSSSGDRAVGSQGIQNISAYTGMVFGDEQGESYVRSLAMFLEGVMEVSDDSQVDARSSEGLQLVQEYIRGKVEQLTRGASSIADKVAAVVRDESHGRESQVDSRIPLSLWNQDNYRTVNMKPAETSKSRMSEETTVKKEPVDNAVTEVLRGVERKPLHMSSQQGWDEVQMVDIRQVIHDIRSWPELQRKKSDYALWRKLLVELDSLILSTTSRAPSANTTSEDDKEAAALKVQWGEKWAGGDSVENRKWVWDYLQHNSDEIRRLSELLTAENKGNSSLDSTRKELIESVRKRLIEMVRFLPLSEINPSKLPPPVAPASASAPTSAVSPGSNAAPPTTAVTTPVATAVAGTTTVPAAEAASISASITATSTTPASTTPASAAFVSLAPVTSVPTATSPSVMPTAAEPTTTAQ